MKDSKPSKGQGKPLTDAAIRSAKPESKAHKLHDEKGLFLHVSTSGGKYWRFRYRLAGQGKELALGIYPDVGLKEARERRDEARQQVASGIDPGEAKRERKAASLARAANTFEAVAGRWFDIWRAGVAEKTASRVWRNLERHIFPSIGALPVANIRAKTVLGVLRVMEAKGLGALVRMAKNAVSQVMRHAVQEGLIEVDPVPSLKGALKAVPQGHHPAITDPVRFGQLLRDIDGYTENRGPELRAALRLLALIFVRPGEMLAMKWADINFETGEWKYHVNKTKVDHLVPLARQAITILQELRARQQLEVRLHDCPLVFPGSGRHGARNPIVTESLNSALRRLGYVTDNETAPNGHSAHGFRASARTMLAEVLHFPPEIIEHQLAHKVPDILGTSYNRTKYLRERRAMMQGWADYLDELRTGARIISMRRA
ncbi:MAG: integrase arm-type DNA-binding domain-containing protein [Zoogloeaceae bacterium]|nr:integrase arm-type DNA-binding domain-containing protein [Zoogloeaceae bacterium]